MLNETTSVQDNGTGRQFHYHINTGDAHCFYEDPLKRVGAYTSMLEFGVHLNLCNSMQTYTLDVVNILGLQVDLTLFLGRQVVRGLCVDCHMLVDQLHQSNVDYACAYSHVCCPLYFG